MTLSRYGKYKSPRGKRTYVVSKATGGMRN